MKLTQSELNDFNRKYLDLRKKSVPNVITHDTNTTGEHRRLVNDICEWLRENDITFYTRCFTKTGEIVDIVAPGLPRPFIEVRHTELKKEKKYDEEFDKLRIFIDTSDPYRLR